MSEHVRAGGSRIHRIIACPGSLHAPDSEAGPAAAKGTAAHHIGERCIMTGCDPDHPSFLGQTVMGVKVDRAMVDGVSVYVNWARGLKDRATPPYSVFLEHAVDWAKLNPPEPMRGSADFIMVVPSAQLMVVGDYKNGTEYVEHLGNKQLRYYAIGALMTLPRELTMQVRKVQLTIIQPNVPGISDDQMVRSEIVDVGDLIDFAEDAMAAVRAGQPADAPRNPGKHCKYCSLAGDCQARADGAVAVAQEEFAVIDGTTLASIPTPVLAEAVARVEDRMAAVDQWLKDAKARLEAELKAGVDVPGWKMVAKRAERVWNDKEAVLTWARLDMDLKDDDVLTPRELKSPAQLEAIVGKKKLPATLYQSISSGYNLARSTSAKPAVLLSAGDEFEAVKP